MKQSILKIHPDDNIIVALKSFSAGEIINMEDILISLKEDIPIKHKFAAKDFEKGEAIIMYGVTVGKAIKEISTGQRISTENVIHASGKYEIGQQKHTWTIPDITKFKGRTFNGYHRADGKVGTRNYWLVIPLVFCENRNLKVIRESMTEQLGYVTDKNFSVDISSLIQKYKKGASAENILQTDILKSREELHQFRIFPNIDGIKFLSHDGGCGGTRQDSEALCRLLAGYITHPNVAGATVLSLGCQHAQIPLLQAAIHEFDPGFSKPMHILEQQNSSSERVFIAEAVKKTLCRLDGSQ
jgi:altronate hydrolase